MLGAKKANFINGLLLVVLLISKAPIKTKKAKDWLRLIQI
jgi:hypothetical protein